MTTADARGQLTNLVEFLLARIGEDEAAARDSFYQGQRWYSEEESVQSYPGADDDDRVWMSDMKRDSHHIVRWQPARVLVECQAKRRIVELAAPWAAYTGENNGMARVVQDMNLRLLALPYGDHPDYNEAWRA